MRLRGQKYYFGGCCAAYELQKELFRRGSSHSHSYALPELMAHDVLGKGEAILPIVLVCPYNACCIYHIMKKNCVTLAIV